MIKVFFEGSIFLHQKNGGISKYIQKINEYFLRHNIASIIFSPLTINDNLDNKKSNNIYYIRLNKIPKFFTKIFYLINNILTIIYLKITKPDILHFSYYNKSLKSYINIPYVLTVYDLIHEKMKLNQKRFNKTDLINHAKHIICISKETKNDLMKLYKVKNDKISVIYPGVILNKNKNKKKIKKKNYILFVGSRKRYKNFVNFIKAYSKSKYLSKNFKIVCFGSEKFNDLEIKILTKLKILTNVVFESGNDTKLNRLYEEANLFVSTSLYEGFGLTPLEAMSNRCPVICSNIPIFKEILGNACEYTDSKNINNIKEIMEKVLKSKTKQKQLVQRGLKKIKKYSWNKCAFETAKIYKRIVLK
jgi:glycosyltransferase involved in cell wall biosynthesis